MQKSLQITTSKNREVVDITDEVSKHLPEGDGLVMVFVAHTTCAVTTADLDPGMEDNMLEAFWDMIPKRNFFHHNPAHVPAHLLSSIIGPSVTAPYSSDKLRLGTWQRIVLIELDGPRDRTVIVNL